MFTKIATVSIPVQDQQAAKSFYTEKLGARVVQDVPLGPEGGARWLRLEFPGVETRIVLVNWFPQMPPGSLQGLVVETADLAQTHAELVRRGVLLSPIDSQPYGKQATFNDPDGNGWVLLQPAG